ncbi:MAG: hypothetical protein F4Y44_03790 [Chloroflexi bacterium]|nr:hypothetical protein [Chloroflexota bacterium]
MVERNGHYGEGFAAQSGGLSEEIRELLRKPLDVSLVKQRKGPGGRSLSYIESYTVIDQANRIFGEGNWRYEVTDGPTLRRIEIVDRHTGEVTKVEQYYTARVAVYLYGRKMFEDVGSNIVAAPREGNTPGAEAHETSYKGCVSDALKRAMRGFGAQFGNSLYAGDGAQGAVNSDPNAPACPVHGTGRHVRRSSRGDGYYCAHKLRDGSYCAATPRRPTSSQPPPRYEQTGDGPVPIEDDWGYPDDAQNGVSGGNASEGAPTWQNLHDVYMKFAEMAGVAPEQVAAGFEKRFGRPLQEATVDELALLVQKAQQIVSEQS